MTAANRTADGFTPLRFGLLLALLIIAMFPQVIFGTQTFVARDFGFFAWPLAHFQQECFWRGELPFWNPYNNCGIPFLAQWNTMPLYPPSLLYLTLPLQWSLGFFSLAHLWWAGLGMYFLARHWTGNNFAAAFAGILFAFNGFTLNLIMWPSHIATFSWLPWVIFAIEAACRDGGRKIILAALVGALQMLAGGPETILLTWLIATTLAAQDWIGQQPPRRALLWRLPAIVALVFALSAVQLLPFLDLVAHAQRATGYTDLRWSMPGLGLANFLVPMAFGSTATEGIFFQHGQYWTSSYYLGLGTLWLALLSLLGLRTRRVWLLAAVGAAGLLCALGVNTPFYPLLRKLVPQLSFITYPIKFVAVIVFTAPLLAAFALANLEKFRKQLFPTGILLLALLTGVLVWTQLAPLPGDDTHAALLNGFSRAAILLLTGGTLFWLVRKNNSPELRFAPVVLLLLAWADTITHEPSQNPTTSPNVYAQNLVRTKLAMQPQPEFGGARAMLSPAAALELTRFALHDPANNFLAKRVGYCADANLLDAVPKVDGFFSLTPREFDRLLTFIYSTTNADFSGLKNFMGVAHITAPGESLKWQTRPDFLPLVTAGQRPVYLDDTNALYALAATNFDGAKIVLLSPEDKSSVNTTSDVTATVLNSHFTDRTVEAQVDATAPTVVVIAQTFYHNWRATVDGHTVPLLRANVSFQAVPVPAGQHRIRLEYVDTAFLWGAQISLAALGLSCVMIMLGSRRQPM